MNFLIRILQSLFRQTPPPLRLQCSAVVWRSGVTELRRRTRGRQESGAFLLGRRNGEVRVIHDFLFYDDIDPQCFRRGIVEFNGRYLGKVWEICRERQLEVVADVHVHPGSSHQSESDKNNPIIAEVGHLALILPNFARDTCLPGHIGMYEYHGACSWTSHSHLGNRFFEVTA
ncbi:hypothetical protein [Noviherbaspirillum malthae]|jgi:proteasome lid subunit RPN8/RPN11|uniref:hypothetical protein n=1 Tax=Noviherbaspirillum malthae TaxID=1260987 RepID=UPI00188F38D9|nr:hypothetical protein [Noviherbaspirillum malthae]